MIHAKQTDSVQPVIYPRDRHNISRKNIDRDALKILYRLKKSGFQAYLVGGGVRDLLLGIKPKDFDIGTDARPKQIRSLFRNSRVIGRRFRLVHVYFRGSKIIEVATFRSGSRSDDAFENGSASDKPISSDNIYGTSATDAFRRDLTINALFYDLATFSVIDYVGGVEDLQAGVTRIIGDPDQRFHEDPVRLIRTVRHSARIGFRIEENTLNSLHKNRDLIKQASQMRLYEEMRKDLCSGSSLTILRALARHRLLEFSLPELTVDSGFPLSDSCELASCLGRLDTLISQGEDISSTAILSLIGIFAGCWDFRLIDLPSRFSSRPELDSHLDECFPKLAVPKKEKEKIKLTVGAWFSLLQTPVIRMRASELAGRPYLTDLKHLFKLLSCTREDEDIIKVLERAERQRENVKRQKKKKQKSKQKESKRRVPKKFL